MMHLVAGWVKEGSMVFCQKNILEHSKGFNGDYMKGCLLTHGVVTYLKYISANRLFFYKSYENDKPEGLGSETNWREAQSL